MTGGGRCPFFGRAVLRFAPDRYAILGSASDRPPKKRQGLRPRLEQTAC